MPQCIDVSIINILKHKVKLNQYSNSDLGEQLR